MDRKVIIALVLSMLVIFLYPYVLNRFYPQVKEAPKATTAQKEGKAQAPAPGAPAQALLPLESPVTVQTPLIKAVLNSSGAGLKTWELKKYKEALTPESPTIDLAKTIARADSFRTELKQNGSTEVIEFRPSKTELTVSGNETSEVVFSGTSKSGLKVEKKYVFSASSYLVSTELKVVNGGINPFSGALETVISTNAAGKDSTGYHVGPVALTKDKLIRQSDKTVQDSAAGLKWLGMENKYFLNAIVPQQAPNASWTSEVASAASAEAKLDYKLDLAPGQSAVYGYTAFLGPKEYDLLLSRKNGLEESIEFGYFGFMAKPFLVVLNFLQRYLVNYGLAIVVLTVVIKIIFYPLTKHSLKSMKEMQNMQPQLAALKEKYKDNKEKMNKELMELYKRYKINPVGGCLPMVLQIPVFIALYEVLYVAIELRHAPLFLWIRDLSDKDPYYVTPLIMGATMFIQQKMSPSTPDPQQAKIMLIMPVIFTFMFLKFPSGLVLYWLINNVLSIAQQYYIQKAPAKA